MIIESSPSQDVDLTLSPESADEEPSDQLGLASGNDPLLVRIRRAEARVTVIGLGYVGLPLALAFADAGFSVHGLDIDARKIASLADGQSYIDDVSNERIARSARSGRFV